MAVRPHEAFSFEEAFKEGVEFGKEQGLRDGLKAGRIEGRNEERNKQDAREPNRGGRLARRPYTGAPGEPSYFRDLLLVHRANRADSRVRSSETTQAHARLAKLAEQQQRDIGMSEWPFVATPTPPFITELIATSARAKAKLPGILRLEPLPESGLKVQTAKVTSSATAAARADKGAVAESDPTASLVDGPVAEVAARIDAGRVLHARADGIDQALARELGEAIATSIDDGLLYGNGSSPNLSGLADTTGIETNAFAGSTQQDLAVAILELVAEVSTNVGNADSLAVLLHPRRAAWLAATVATPGEHGVFSGIMPPLVGLDLRWFTVPTISTTINTTEDEIWVLAPDELPVMVGPLTIAVHEDLAESATGVVRVSAYQFASTLFVRKPEAIGRLTGLTTPSFA